MSAAAAKSVDDAGAAEGGKPKGGKKKLILLAAPVLLVAILAGLWFGGILPPLLGMGAPAAEAAGDDSHAAPAAHAAAPAAPAAGGHGAPPKADAHGAPAKADAHGAKPAAAAGGGAGHESKAMADAARGGANFIELPEVVANLNAGARRASYVKLRPRIEIARPQDEAAVRNAMPRLLDLFQTYLREMRPEELRGSAGTYRLREELIARANIALAPVRVVDVLLPEMLVQ